MPARVALRFTPRSYTAQVVGSFAMVDVLGVRDDQRAQIPCAVEDDQWRVDVVLPELPPTMSLVDTKQIFLVMSISPSASAQASAEQGDRPSRWVDDPAAQRHVDGLESAVVEGSRISRASDATYSVYGGLMPDPSDVPEAVGSGRADASFCSGCGAQGAAAGGD